MTRVIHVLALLSCASAAAGATIPIQPSRQDFGKVAVKGAVTKLFNVSMPAGARPGDIVSVSFTGADPSEFSVGLTGSANVQDDCDIDQAWNMSMQTGPTCVIAVAFSPQSLGAKSATLVVSDSGGNRGTVALTGQGVAPLCEMKVVFCNYAHLYSGSFRWKSGISAGNSGTDITVDVQVTKGVATCNGSERIWDANGSMTGPITGSGLLAVEYMTDDQNRLVYNITAACPSPQFPGDTFQRAELGHNDQQSYPQVTMDYGLDLIGTNSYPAPEVDPVNGVTGAVDVSWDLRR